MASACEQIGSMFGLSAQIKLKHQECLLHLEVRPVSALQEGHERQIRNINAVKSGRGLTVVAAAGRVLKSNRPL